jgi:hypothetical protein
MPKVKGVAPGFLLLPAREYNWELQKKIEFRLPLKGHIDEIIKKDIMPEGIKISGDNEYSIFEDNLLLLWELVRVMFAGHRYPQLNDDECLNVVALEFTDDEVIIYGEVIRSIPDDG